MKTVKLIFNSTSNVGLLAKECNTFRLQNKNQWYQIVFENETSGKETYLKCFDTWIQVAQYNGFSTVSDMKPKEFLANIEKGLSRLISNY